jgi:hypothetical protein
MRSLSKAQDFAEVERRLLSVQPGDPGLWGEMTVEQMLAHVAGAFRVGMGELPAGDVPRQPLRPQLMKFAALRLPMQWPQGLQTVGSLKVGAPAMQTAAFAEQRQMVLREMHRFARREQPRVDHAMFGAMTYGDWMRWGYLHMDHHLRQFGR